jgi:hypothetical protein
MIKDKISREEIEKWIKKLEIKLQSTQLKDSKYQRFFDNIHAYVKDSKYWIEKGDYIKAWEVISFAWGLFEAGEDLGVLN